MGTNPGEIFASEILMLAHGRATIACAESCTGGAIGALLTDVPGMSAIFRGGIIAYAPTVKKKLLNVPEQVLEEQGVFSCACAQAMACGAARTLESDFAVATTGVAGPNDEDGVPAGTVYIGVAAPSGVVAEKFFFSGASREQVKILAVEAALRLLRDQIREALSR